ncbi:hypothetical protein OROGR_014642 [Orobanche gracilis]
MVGGGNRRDEGSFTVSNTNVFAALARKKKKSDRENGSSKGGKSTSKAAAEKSKEAVKKVYWAPAPLTSKSWADVDDEDDDDYYATTAPPRAIWGGPSKSEEIHEPDPMEAMTTAAAILLKEYFRSESESEDGLIDEGDDYVDDEHEPEVQEQPQLMLKKPVEASPAPKEAERQLSKKERRKKELDELEVILSDFGVNPKEKAEDEPSDVAKDSKEGQSNGDADRDNNAPTEPKNAKKKKKKDKASKEGKESEDRPNSSDALNGPDETTGTEPADEDASGIDVKEKLKKMASVKKKKSGKEMGAAARSAALEAAARSARLAAAKKKEKNHYNQQPMR